MVVSAINVIKDSTQIEKPRESDMFGFRKIISFLL
jgi:hypothetical protein